MLHHSVSFYAAQLDRFDALLGSPSPVSDLSCGYDVDAPNYRCRDAGSRDFWHPSQVAFSGTDCNSQVLNPWDEVQIITDPMHE